jgi:carbonic anhydrase
MRIMKRNLLLVCVLVVAIIACSQQADTRHAAAVPSKAEPAAASHAGPHWSYEGEAGPAAWGTLSPDWSPCGGGKNQSPIDIDQTVRADLPEMRAAYPPVSLKIIHAAHIADGINNGHTIQVNYTNGDVLTIGSEQFQLVQYHFHIPSEHTVKGQHHAMEMHLVHKSAAGRLAVIGVFIDEGAHNAAFDPLLANLPSTKGAETHINDVMVDVNQLLPSSLESYRYDGSLTTPPCSEGVKWIVMTTPIQMSAEQIAAFRALINGNNRPVQPLNGRTVETDKIATSP